MRPLNMFDPNELDAMIYRYYNPPSGWVKSYEAAGGRIGIRRPLIDVLRNFHNRYQGELMLCDNQVDFKDYYDRDASEWLYDTIPWSEERKEARREKCRRMIAAIDARIAALEKQQSSY